MSISSMKEMLQEPRCEKRQQQQQQQQQHKQQQIMMLTFCRIILANPANKYT